MTRLVRIPPRLAVLARLEHDFDHAILLFLEHLVSIRRGLEWENMGDDVVDAQLITIADQRQNLIRPSAHIALSHADRDLAVEEIADMQHRHPSEIDAADGHRATAADGGEAIDQRMQ